MTDVQITFKNLSPKITASAKRQARREIEKEFNRVRAEIITRFYNDPVTIDILDGMNNPTSTRNASGTLGGYGNLYAFIGFSGENPIDPILELFEKAKLDKIESTRTGYQCTFSIPTAEEIFEATPMPWATGRSWAQGIESGIAGFGKFLHKLKLSSKSRSGGGWQIKKKIRGGKFQNTKYISHYVNQFIKKTNEISIRP